MVSAAAGKARAASAHAVNNIAVRNFHIDRVIDLGIQILKRACQRFRLRYGSRETVQYVAVSAVFLLNTVHYKIAGQLVRNEQALVHIGLCLIPQFRSVLDICAENITCGDMRNLILLGNLLCLCSFSCSRST